jgi:hypothetical protein
MCISIEMAGMLPKPVMTYVWREKRLFERASYADMPVASLSSSHTSG